MSNNTRNPVIRREHTQPHLTVLQTHDRDDLEQIRPIGEIDLCSAPVLRDALADAERRQVKNVLVDLSDVQFLALVGVHVLRDAGERSTAEHRRMVLVAPSHPVQRVLSLTNATADLEVYVTQAGALSALNRI
ncbi:STAS domain-containing protein [Actinophytocola glycyrrhizae]|uniref:STAS domain-containing protein n=1 Tax=Actinophytocola glycyrrhizae TaxID=2044873 RepID=A0ABV9S2T1_9PSEU